MGFLRKLMGLSPTAADFAEQASGHAEKGEYDLAIADYAEAIGLLPREASLWIGRGQAYRDLGDRERAL